MNLGAVSGRIVKVIVAHCRQSCACQCIPEHRPDIVGRGSQRRNGTCIAGSSQEPTLASAFRSEASLSAQNASSNCDQPSRLPIRWGPSSASEPQRLVAGHPLCTPDSKLRIPQPRFRGVARHAPNGFQRTGAAKKSRIRRRNLAHNTRPRPLAFRISGRSSGLRLTEAVG